MLIQLDFPNEIVYKHCNYFNNLLLLTHYSFFMQMTRTNTIANAHDGGLVTPIVLTSSEKEVFSVGGNDISNLLKKLKRCTFIKFIYVRSIVKYRVLLMGHWTFVSSGFGVKKTGSVVMSKCVKYYWFFQ